MIHRLRVHSSGLIYSVLVILVAVMAMNNQNNLLFWVLGVLVAGLAISAAISTLIVRAVQVRRVDPQHGVVGEPLVVRYAVTNRFRFMSVFNIHVEEVRDPRPTNGLAGHAHAWIMHVGPRETVHGEAVLWPARRGRVRFEAIRVWTTFPFGILRKSRVFRQPQETLIYPMQHRLRPGLLRSITPPALLGSKVSPHAGAGDDYFGIREYRPGDSMRHIAWKRTARLDLLIAIDRTSPSPSKLRLVLDLSTPPDRLLVDSTSQARELEEAAISLAASFIRAAELEGYEIGLTVLGFSLPPIPVRRNRWHANKMLAALAGLDLDAPRAAPQPPPVRDAERAAILVVAPDRAKPLPGREDAWYFTARQLPELVASPTIAGTHQSPREAPKSPARVARASKRVAEHAA